MNIDDELLLDAQEDALEIAFIQSHLPQELQEKFSEEDLYYILDVIIDYYASTGVFDAEPDADGCVDIDLDQVVAYVLKQARKEKVGEWEHDDILFVVQAELDYAEQNGEE